MSTKKRTNPEIRPILRANQHDFNRVITNN